MDKQPDIASLIPAIAALSHAVHARQRQLMRAASSPAARRLQGRTLAALLAIPDDGIRQDALARQLNLAPSDADYAVGALREAGLLTEKRSRTDRRKVDLRLTAAGAAAVDEHRAQLLPPMKGEEGPRLMLDVGDTIALLEAITAELNDQIKDSADKDRG